VIVGILDLNAGDISTTLGKRGGVVNVVCAGETSWHGFANAIVTGLRSRGVNLLVENIIAIRTDEFPVKAKRPANSRLDLTRLREDFGIAMPSWEEALAYELDEMTGNAK
jgi:dTDP-4-dehydrorhamnose reductase